MENNSEPQSIDYSKAAKIPLKRGRRTEQNGQKFYTLPPVQEPLPLVQEPLPLEKEPLPLVQEPLLVPLEKEPSPPMFLPHSPTYEKVELPKQESPPYKKRESPLNKKRESPLDKKKSSSEESQDLKLEDFVDHYFNEKDIDRNKNHEIEVRFGTKKKRETFE
jgi:hypothetical protein